MNQRDETRILPPIWSPLELEIQTKLYWNITKMQTLLQSKHSEVRKTALFCLYNDKRETGIGLNLHNFIMAESDPKCIELILTLILGIVSNKISIVTIFGHEQFK